MLNVIGPECDGEGGGREWWVEAEGNVFVLVMVMNEYDLRTHGYIDLRTHKIKALRQE